MELIRPWWKRRGEREDMLRQVRMDVHMALHEMGRGGTPSKLRPYLGRAEARPGYARRAGPGVSSDGETISCPATAARSAGQHVRASCFDGWTPLRPRSDTRARITSSRRTMSRSTPTDPHPLAWLEREAAEARERFLCRRVQSAGHGSSVGKTSPRADGGPGMTLEVDRIYCGTVSTSCARCPDKCIDLVLHRSALWESA